MLLFFFNVDVYRLSVWGTTELRNCNLYVPLSNCICPVSGNRLYWDSQVRQVPAVLISVWQRHVYCNSPGFSVFLEVSCLFMCFFPLSRHGFKKESNDHIQSCVSELISLNVCAPPLFGITKGVEVQRLNKEILFTAFLSWDMIIISLVKTSSEILTPC